MNNRSFLIFILFWFSFSIFGTGYDSPDEHFPTLEAAGGLLFGYFHPTWEWDEGLRSWLQPIIEAGWLWPFVKLKITNRQLLDTLLRVFNSLIWYWGACGAKTLSLNRGINESQSENVKWSLLFFSPFVIWGTRHGSDLFCIPFFLQLLAVLSDKKQHISRTILAGVLAATVFQIRFTTGPLLAILAVLLFLEKEIKQMTFLIACASALITFSIYSWIDSIFYFRFGGIPHFAAGGFFRYNILETSKTFHKSPFWEPWFYFVLFLSPSLLFAKKELFAKNDRFMGVLILSQLLIWSVLRHFEFRFLMPTLALALLVLGRNAKAQFIHIIILLPALIFYSDPHFSLISALNHLHETSVVTVASTGGMPTFYSSQNVYLKNIPFEEWKNFCNDDFNSLNKFNTNSWRPIDKFQSQPVASAFNPSHFQVITPSKCESNASNHGGRCKLEFELSESLGRKLRKKLSPISSPGFIYDCSL